MKVTRLLLTMSCAASMLGMGYAAALEAAPHDEAEHHTVGVPTGGRKDSHRASNTNHARSHASLANTNRPKQLPNSRERLTARNPRNVRESGQNKSGVAAKKGSIQNKTVSGTPAVRPPHVFRSSALSPENVRHRGPNPAVIAGSANSRTGNTGTINGTHMSRRP